MYLSIAVGQGFEAYSFSTPFGYIFPTVKSTAKAFRIPRNSPPGLFLVLAAQKQNHPGRLELEPLIALPCLAE